MQKYLPEFFKVLGYDFPVEIEKHNLEISWRHLASFSLNILDTVPDYYRVRELSIVLISDLARLKNRNIIMGKKITTFASYVCSYMANRSLMVGEIGDTFDWLKASVRDGIEYNCNPEEEITFSVQRIINIMRDDVLVEIAPHAGFEWLGTLFYYAARYGGHTEIAENFEGLTFEFIKAQIKVKVDSILISLIKRFSYYLVQYERPLCSQFAELLLQARKTVPPRSNIYCELTSILSTRISEFTESLEHKVFAMEVVEGCADSLNHFEFMQTAGNALTAETRQKILPIILKFLREWRHEIQNTANQLYINSELARLFPNIASSMMSLASIGANKDIINIFKEWSGNDFANYLLVFVSYKDGVVFVDDTHCKIIDSHEHVDNYMNLVVSFNSFLETSLVVKHKSFNMPKPGRLMGAPTPKSEHRMLPNQIANTYSWKMCPPQNDSERQMIVIPASPHPTQSIMLRELGWTLPLSASFAQPKPDRNFEKVLILKGESHYTDVEIDSVLRSLKHISIEILDDDKYDLSSTINRFDPDVIWVLGHGEYDHYSPQRSKIHTYIEIGLPEFGMCQ